VLKNQLLQVFILVFSIFFIKKHENERHRIETQNYAPIMIFIGL